MKTTIIKILNQIANGEEPPKKILWKNEEYIYMEEPRNYQCLTEPYEMMDIYDGWCLNDEVEILETTITYNQDNDYQYQPYTGEAEIKCNSPKNILESNKIEKLYLENIHTTDTFNLCEHTNEQFEEVNNKINELIDRYNNDRE